MYHCVRVRRLVPILLVLVLVPSVVTASWYRCAYDGVTRAACCCQAKAQTSKPRPPDPVESVRAACCCTITQVSSTAPAGQASTALSLDHHLVALEDPAHNFLAGNIVPLVNSQKKSDRLKEVLDAVSAKLTTEGVAGLNAAVAGNSGIDPDQAARNWLRDNDFNHAVGQ